MKQTFEILGYNQILNQLRLNANTIQGKEMASNLRPFLSEIELRKNLRETTQARQFLEEAGTPPIPIMEHVEEDIGKAVKGELLLPERIEQIGTFLAAIKRLKTYLELGKEKEISLAFYSDNLICQEDLRREIERSIRGGKIDDYASNTLRDIRKQIILLEEKIKQKAESILRANKSYTSDSFIVTRNGRLCIPLKKEYKNKVPGSVVDKSSTGSTLFLEPKAVMQLSEELEIYKIEEDTEERRILYQLMDMIAGREIEMLDNIRVITMLDFIFAKGKLSMDMDAVESAINLDRYIYLEQARHPLLGKEECVPLQFEIGHGTRGIIITGPNTGGKTVAIKTVGLLSMMACSGLHIPCQNADIAMNSQVLCDIGDGQNISDNLSTFSAHIRNVIEILKRVNEDTLVILDELGSGTDPAEGMGIAIAILEQLRLSGCLFLATTHYPEVKEYADRHGEIVNARMAFDRESLRPLYRLEIGKSGESCALYIAKRLGLPDMMVRMAAEEAYGNQAQGLIEELNLNRRNESLPKVSGPKLQKKTPVQKEAVHGKGYQRGDSVLVMPDNKIGIVVKPADGQGNVQVQVKKEKFLINHKRLKLKVSAQELYPEDYDFSILFETVENRKKRHRMGKGYQEGMVIEMEETVVKWESEL